MSRRPKRHATGKLSHAEMPQQGTVTKEDKAKYWLDNYLYEWGWHHEDTPKLCRFFYHPHHLLEQVGMELYRKDGIKYPSAINKKRSMSYIRNYGTAGVHYAEGLEGLYNMLNQYGVFTIPEEPGGVPELIRLNLPVISIENVGSEISYRDEADRQGKVARRDPAMTHATSRNEQGASKTPAATCVGFLHEFSAHDRSIHAGAPSADGFMCALPTSDFEEARHPGALISSARCSGLPKARVPVTGTTPTGTRLMQSLQAGGVQEKSLPGKTDGRAKMAVKVPVGAGFSFAAPEPRPRPFDCVVSTASRPNRASAPESVRGSFQTHVERSSASARTTDPGARGDAAASAAAATIASPSSSVALFDIMSMLGALTQGEKEKLRSILSYLLKSEGAAAAVAPATTRLTGTRLEESGRADREGGAAAATAVCGRIARLLPNLTREDLDRLAQVL
jgi:hypothetical protein